MDMTKVPYGCVNQNLANVAFAKSCLLRAFPKSVIFNINEYMEV